MIWLRKIYAFQCITIRKLRILRVSTWESQVKTFQLQISSNERQAAILIGFFFDLFVSKIWILNHSKAILLGHSECASVALFGHLTGGTASLFGILAKSRRIFSSSPLSGLHCEGLNFESDCWMVVSSESLFNIFVSQKRIRPTTFFGSHSKSEFRSFWFSPQLFTKESLAKKVFAL